MHFGPIREPGKRYFIDLPETFRNAAKRDSEVPYPDTFVGGCMQLTSRWRWSTPFVAAGIGLLLASCSETTTISAPAARPTGPASSSRVASFSSPGSALQLAINSGDATVHYCGFQPTTLPGLLTFSPDDCADAAANLTVPLLAYTPGDPTWAAPLAGSSWIGPTGIDLLSNEYRARVGSYKYATAFYLPPGATSIALQMQLMADNAAVVYLNGTEIGRHEFLEDCTIEQLSATGNCNWSLPIKITDSPAAFNLNALNVLRVDVVNTHIGEVAAGHTPRSNCFNGPQLFGHVGLSSTLVLTSAGHELLNWLASGCQNPTGVDFQTKVFFTPPTPLFVIGDDEAHGINDVVNFWGAQWWKNNDMSGTTDPGYESFKGFASSADNFCGGAWSTEPGNSSNPPATIPSDIAIIVTSKVLKNGSTLSGDIKEIVVVHQDGNYADNPGHAGGGAVTRILCSSD